MIPSYQRITIQGIKVSEWLRLSTFQRQLASQPGAPPQGVAGRYEFIYTKVLQWGLVLAPRQSPTGFGEIVELYHNLSVIDIWLKAIPAQQCDSALAVHEHHLI